jgi:hypothetical protein
MFLLMLSWHVVEAVVDELVQEFILQSLYAIINYRGITPVFILLFGKLMCPQRYIVYVASIS